MFGNPVYWASTLIFICCFSKDCCEQSHDIKNSYLTEIIRTYLYDFMYFCYILTFWPGLKCHSKVMHRKEVTHSNGSYERKSRGRKLADEMGRAKKFPWYTHRLLHRKRVTCELHDSYFRLMTIKHSISAIEWALNYYIAQSRRKSRQLSRVPVTVGDGGRRVVVGKADGVWGTEKLLIRCSKGRHYPAEWASGPPVEHQENKKDTTLTAIRVGVKILQLCSISNSLSHANFE